MVSGIHTCHCLFSHIKQAQLKIFFNKFKPVVKIACKNEVGKEFSGV